MTTDPGRIICQRVTQEVASVAPKGLGRWPEAWRIVEEPSTRFLDRLAEWEHADTADTRRRLHAAAVEVVEAWRRAAEAWGRAGRPAGTWEPTPAGVDGEAAHA